jgi:LPXTG-site transpeptidase (sortase) family protein
MTVTTSEPAVEAIPTEEEEKSPRARPVGAAPAWQRIAVAGAVVILVVWGISWLFEGPVATAWYHSRQSQLSGDFQTPSTNVSRGHAIAVMQIPRVRMNVIVIQGDGASQLRGAPGHREGTPLPGKRGNSVILGHRAAWGGPFGRLAKLRKGDLIGVQRRGMSDAVVFKVIRKSTVSAGDTGVYRPSNDHRLTLITSVGGLRNSKRLVVVAVSGDTGSRLPKRALPHDASSGDDALVLTLCVAFAAASAAFASFLILRRRKYRGLAIAAVVIPLGLTALMASMVALDVVLLPPLR